MHHDVHSIHTAPTLTQLISGNVSERKIEGCKKGLQIPKQSYRVRDGWDGTVSCEGPKFKKI